VDGVVVHRLASDGEQPVLRGALRDVVADVTGEDAHELVGQVDGSLRAVLGSTQDVRRPLPLELPGDRELPARQVEVAELYCGGLGLPQAGEGAERDVGAEALACRDPLAVGVLEQTSHLLDGGDPHRGVCPATSGQDDACARVSGDHPLGDRGSEDRANDDEPCLDGRGRETTALVLHPLLDVRATDASHCQVGEGHRPGGEVGVGPGRGHPQLPDGPSLIELLERHLPGVGIDVGPGQDGGRDLVEPALRVDLAVEVAGPLAPLLVAVAGAPATVGPLGDVSGHGCSLPCFQCQSSAE
jgi:hypothetical protein